MGALSSVGVKRQSNGRLVTLGTPLPETTVSPVTASAAAPVQLPAPELPRGRRPGWATLAALGIVTGLGALGLGIGAIVAQDRAPAAEPSPATEASLAVLADSSAERYVLRGSVERIALVVDADGRAVLTLDGLGPAAPGRVYQAWVVAPASATPRPAGTFDGLSRVVPLERRVAEGARVAVTLESGDGSLRPSRPLRLVAVRA